MGGSVLLAWGNAKRYPIRRGILPLGARQAALAWGRDLGVVQDLCRRKEIPGALRGGDGYYKIPKGPGPPGLPKRDKLTEEEGREIARLVHAGANRTRLAEKRGIKRSHVH